MIRRHASVVVIKVEMRLGSSFIGLSQYRAIKYRQKNGRLACSMHWFKLQKSVLCFVFESAIITFFVLLNRRPSQRRIHFCHKHLKWFYFQPYKMGPDESRRETKTRKNSSGLDATHQTVSFLDSGLLALLALLGWQPTVQPSGPSFRQFVRDEWRWHHRKADRKEDPSCRERLNASVPTRNKGMIISIALYVYFITQFLH